jgi:signal transduction histidine kinase
MKKRFLIVLALVTLLMAFVTFFLSNFAVQRITEQLILEKANTRLSIIVQGFNNVSNDVDIYSYIVFPYENVSIRKGELVVFQYGTSALNQDSTEVRKLQTMRGGYDFVLFIDLGREVTNYLSPFRRIILICIVLNAVIFAIAGMLFINTVVHPIENLAKSMTKITSNNLRERIEVPARKDEVSQLIVTFNTMLDEIEGTYERLKTFVDDMMHDLVTPVQILEGYRQLIERHGKDRRIIDEFLEVSKVQLFRLKEMTTSLKAAFLVEKRRHVEYASASEITKRNVTYFRDLYPDIHFNASIQEDVILPIEPMDLERIENILIDNAVRYGRDGGIISIELTGSVFSIEDFGAVIMDALPEAPNASAKVPTRDGSEGAGIGLKIVRRFSEEYGFRLDVQTRPGKGSRFALVFPDSLNE